MFLHNDVIEYVDPPGLLLRILWIDDTRALAYTFALRRTGATPRAIPLTELATDVRTRRARLLLTDPCRAPPTAAPSATQRRLQLKAWHAVTALHRELPLVYQARERAAMLGAYAAEHAVSGASVMRYLRRYWERGQTIDALLPDYANSGARGQTRTPTAGIKRGRPRKDAASGTNTDAALRALFFAAAAQYAANHARFSRPAAYRQMVREHFAGCAPDAIPSYGQFNYWLARNAKA